MSERPRLLLLTGDDGHYAKELMRQLDEANRAIDKAKEERQEIVDQLVALCGEHDGITGDWGSFVYEERSRIRWRELAERFAKMVYGNGAGIPQHHIDRHRGVPWREPRLYPNNERETE